ncbi:hypothetical protein AAFF_G00310050 [Aldrovandia affinis]|uniref:Uncharacterized protein n=1 Tax=Aldrovandia affinis TaxID=143900 RepID=A0AAD7SQ76_9TELE|nr:hypothetical protein AAFF_G00310050 [Aldrovandia affinis]
MSLFQCHGLTRLGLLSEILQQTARLLSRVKPGKGELYCEVAYVSIKGVFFRAGLDITVKLSTVLKELLFWEQLASHGALFAPVRTLPFTRRPSCGKRNPPCSEEPCRQAGSARSEIDSALGVRLCAHAAMHVCAGEF